jgi:prolyl-tRNA synthetase
VDDRQNLRPGAKYFEWERKGVPVRLELGPRDIANNVAQMALRHTGAKSQVPLADAELVPVVAQALTAIHAELLAAARQRLDAHTYPVASYAEMKTLIADAAGGPGAGGEDDSGRTSEKRAGFYLVPWKCDRANEAFIKEDCKATIRCYPLALNQVRRPEPPPTPHSCPPGQRNTAFDTRL